MQKVHGLQPANYRKFAVANIYAHEIPMSGQVPVDGAAPNVRVTEDRRGLLYDSYRSLVTQWQKDRPSRCKEGNYLDGSAEADDAKYCEDCDVTHFNSRD